MESYEGSLRLSPGLLVALREKNLSFDWQSLKLPSVRRFISIYILFSFQSAQWRLFSVACADWSGFQSRTSIYANSLPNNNQEWDLGKPGAGTRSIVTISVARLPLSKGRKGALASLGWRTTFSGTPPSTSTRGFPSTCRRGSRAICTRSRGLSVSWVTGCSPNVQILQVDVPAEVVLILRSASSSSSRNSDPLPFYVSSRQTRFCIQSFQTIAFIYGLRRPHIRVCEIFVGHES